MSFSQFLSEQNQVTSGKNFIVKITIFTGLNLRDEKAEIEKILKIAGNISGYNYTVIGKQMCYNGFDYNIMIATLYPYKQDRLRSIEAAFIEAFSNTSQISVIFPPNGYTYKTLIGGIAYFCDLECNFYGNIHDKEMLKHVQAFRKKQNILKNITKMHRIYTVTLKKMVNEKKTDYIRYSNDNFYYSCSKEIIINQLIKTFPNDFPLYVKKELHELFLYKNFVRIEKFPDIEYARYKDGIVNWQTGKVINGETIINPIIKVNKFLTDFCSMECFFKISDIYRENSETINLHYPGFIDKLMGCKKSLYIKSLIGKNGDVLDEYK